MSTIGFIGLGNMGFPMASRLADAGHTLIVDDRDQGAVQRFQDQHPRPDGHGRQGLAGCRHHHHDAAQLRHRRSRTDRGSRPRPPP